MTTWPAGAWHTARHHDADVVLFGDSITAAQGATDVLGRSYAGLVRRRLGRTFGSGGTGFCPHWAGAPGGGVMSGDAHGTAFASSGPNGHVATLSGSARWTMHDVAGTTVQVFLRRGASDGTARWRVDGGPWHTQDCSGSTGYVVAQLHPLEDRGHTVEVEAQSGTVGLHGVAGHRHGGVRSHIMGLGGRTSGGGAFSSATAEATAAFREATVGRWAPHLLVVALGANDSNTANTTPTAYKANVAAVIAAARAARADCDLVLVAHHLGKFADNGYDDMRAALVELADEHGGLVVDLDLWARTHEGATTARTDTDPTGTSWGRWSTWGWWQWATDSIHPGDSGHAVLARVLGDVLTVEEDQPVPWVPDVEWGGLV